VDPLTRDYPMLTPYQFASNSPIANIDLDGAEAKWYMYNFLNGSFDKVKPKINGPVIDEKIKKLGYFSQSQVDNFNRLKKLREYKHPPGYPTIKQEEFTDGSPHTLPIAKGIVKSTPMVFEEVAEIPVLIYYTTKGFFSNDFSDAKMQSVGILLPLINKSSIRSFLKVADEYKGLPQPGSIFPYTVKKDMILMEGIPANGGMDFVINKEGKLILGQGHSSLAKKSDKVINAGRVEIVNGKIDYIDNWSGYYRPGDDKLLEALSDFKAKNLTTMNVELRTVISHD
jgi:hypothetical protein